jgi:hypothetical protein
MLDFLPEQRNLCLKKPKKMYLSCQCGEGSKNRGSPPPPHAIKVRGAFISENETCVPARGAWRLLAHTRKFGLLFNHKN